jgi:hypothetical protein
VTLDWTLLARSDLLFPILGFAGLAVLASWAIFRATDLKKHDDD